MKKLPIFLATVFILSASNLFAQSKKELVESFNAKMDSLNKLLASKDASLQKLELKIAKFEGAAEAHGAIFKRMENKADSLAENIGRKDSTIKSLNAALIKLNSDFEKLQDNHKNLGSENESLQAEIEALKKPAAPSQARVEKSSSIPKKEIVKTELAEPAGKAITPE